MKSKNIKEYKSLYIYAEFNHVTGKSVFDYMHTWHGSDLFSEEEKTIINESYAKYNNILLHSFSELLTFYCNEFNYSVVSASPSPFNETLIYVVFKKD